MPDDTAPLWLSLLGLLVYGVVMGAAIAGGVLFTLLVFALAFVGGVLAAAVAAALM